jgi:hypothetical protein
LSSHVLWHDLHRQYMIYSSTSTEISYISNIHNLRFPDISHFDLPICSPSSFRHTLLLSSITSLLIVRRHSRWIILIPRKLIKQPLAIRH